MFTRELGVRDEVWTDHEVVGYRGIPRKILYSELHQVDIILRRVVWLVLTCAEVSEHQIIPGVDYVIRPEDVLPVAFRPRIRKTREAVRIRQRSDSQHILGGRRE